MSRRREETGAVAIVVALSLTGLLVIVALVFDFGLVRVDRQVDKSAADSAVLAGMHALNGGDANPRPFVGVCTAINYLQQNNDRFSGMTPTSGTWTNGNGVAWPISNPCTDTTYQAKLCTDTASWAKFTWQGTQNGKPLQVIVQSGYLLSPTSGYSEDSLPAALAENNDGAGGCDQLAVLVIQTRKPGLGSLATTSDLKTSIRSVGRVKSIPGGYAPAMLLLKQTGCSILSGANNNTKIYLAGASASNGLTQPGTIHSDSDASGCGNNTWVYEGKQTDNIVAFAAPLFATPTLPDTSKPGQITLYGGSGQTSHFYDSSTNVCGTTMLYTSPVATGLCPSTTAIKQTGRVYRKVVDDRYLATVQKIRDDAEAAFSAAPSYAHIISGGQCNNPPASLTTNLLATDQLYVNCGNFGPNSPVTINAGTVVFAGTVVNPTSLSMPNATKVYVSGDSTVAQNKNGISLGNGRTFAMHNSAGNMSAGLCSSAATGPETSSLTTNKAVLVVRNGTINMTGGSTFRACYTAVVMLSGKGVSPNTDACMPALPSTAAPTLSPCTGSAYTPGTGQLNMSGGNIDWTAPNQHAVMVDSVGSPNPAFANAWSDKNGPEDLAFWSESANGNPSYQLTGGGTVHLVGVFMAPNAQPLTLAGQFAQQLINAQFISSSISLTGGSTITMKVDPGSAVSLPRLDIVGLVR